MGLYAQCRGNKIFEESVMAENCNSVTVCKSVFDVRNHFFGSENIILESFAAEFIVFCAEKIFAHFGVFIISAEILFTAAEISGRAAAFNKFGADFKQRLFGFSVADTRSGSEAAKK